MSHTVDFYISSPKVTNCENVAFFLQKMNIKCCITPNISVIKRNNDEYDIERGCNVKLCKIKTKQVEPIWKSLKDEYNLDCAYLSFHGNFKGCIHNFLRESECPTKKL